MSSHIVIDGNAFYEIDEECMRRMKNGTSGKGREKEPEKINGKGNSRQKKGAEKIRG